MSIHLQNHGFDMDSYVQSQRVSKIPKVEYNQFVENLQPLITFDVIHYSILPVTQKIKEEKKHSTRILKYCQNTVIRDHYYTLHQDQNTCPVNGRNNGTQFAERRVCKYVESLA